MANKLNITYWSDYACPYCYIAEKRLEQVLDKMGLNKDVTIKMKAFELNPEAPKDVTSTCLERFAIKYGLSKEDAQKQIDHISELGQNEGIDFKYATTLYTNTFDAHRLTKFAEAQGNSELAQKVIKLLFDAYFTQNLKLADENVLLNVAEKVGLNAEDAKKMLASDEYKYDVRTDEQEAYANGVHAVPFFVINGKYALPGALSKDAMEKMINKVVAEQTQNAEKEIALSCGPEGCALR